MRGWDRWVPGGFLIAFSLTIATAVSGAENPFPGVASAYLIKIEEQTVWAGGATKRLPPASLTKIMTALLAIEAGRLDEVVVIGQAAARETGSRLGLKAGDRMTAADLLTATLVRSANDACHALADWRAGSEARFVRLMNRRAAELGLRDTRFVNACGHDAPGHYASASDLAALAEVAMRRPLFAELVARSEARLRTVDRRREFLIENTNALIGRFPGAIGVKSGYTRKAGRSLVALAQREGIRVLLVLLNAPNRWWDAHAILERAFALAPEPRGA
jgi:serine-type D-Ala-D-Ala carboxypeptidase (penicillin-binding protein 5/6)